MNERELYNQRLHEFVPELAEAYHNSTLVNLYIQKYAHGHYKTKEECLTALTLTLLERANKYEEAYVDIIRGQLGPICV